MKQNLCLYTELVLEGLGINLSICIRYGFRSFPKTTKIIINKVSKLMQLSYRKYCNIDNCDMSQNNSTVSLINFQICSTKFQPNGGYWLASNDIARRHRISINAVTL